MKFALVSLLAFISFTSAWAGLYATKCPTESKNVAAIYLRQNQAPKALDCQEIEHISSVIDSIRQTFGHVLAMPTKDLSILVQPFNDNAFYAFSFFELPEQFVLNAHSKHPKFTHPIYMHEYGHAIFDQNMKAISQSWAERTPYLEAYGALMLTAEIYQTRVEQIGECKTDDKECFVQLDWIVSALERLQQEKNQLESMTILNTRDVSGSYNELFADLIAVLMSGRGDAIYDGLHMVANEGNKMAQRSFEARDFTNRKNSIDNRDFNTDIAREEHDLMSPVRYHIWKYYLTNPLYHNRPDMIALTLFRTIARELAAESTGNFQTTLPFDNAKVAVERMIVALDTEFAAWQ